jgi:hypothetical protein
MDLFAQESLIIEAPRNNGTSLAATCAQRTIIEVEKLETLPAANPRLKAIEKPH